MTAGDPPRPQSAAMLHVLFLVALSALLLAPGLMSGPSLDAAVFMQVAERMRDGATLYAGIWDHKPPGIYLLLVAGQSLLPFLSVWLVSWLLSVAATAGTGWVVLTVAAGWARPAARPWSRQPSRGHHGRVPPLARRRIDRTDAAVPLALAGLHLRLLSGRPGRAVWGALLGASLLALRPGGRRLRRSGALVWMRGGSRVIAVAACSRDLRRAGRGRRVAGPERRPCRPHSMRS